MHFRNSQTRYGLVAIFIHWATALAIVTMIFVGKYLDGLKFTDPEYNSVYFFHISTGVTIFFLTVVRLIWRILNPPPTAPNNLSGGERILRKIVHWGFYIFLFLIPISGWALSATASEKPWTKIYGSIPWPQMPWIFELENKRELMSPIHQIHEWLVYGMIFLIVLHLAGVIKHTFILKDKLLNRMFSMKKI